VTDGALQCNEMNINIQNLLQHGEGLTTELKTTLSDEVIETLVAFANAGGGAVYVGVTDKGVIRGVMLSGETVQGWINEVKNKTALQIIPDAGELNIQGKTVVKLSVPEYPVKPVAFKGRYYKRVANANHLMSIDEIANEHLKTLNTSWDYYVDPHHSTDDISYDKVSKFIRKLELQTGSAIGMSPEALPESYNVPSDTIIRPKLSAKLW